MKDDTVVVVCALGGWTHKTCLEERSPGRSDIIDHLIQLLNPEKGFGGCLPSLLLLLFFADVLSTTCLLIG